MGVKKTNQQKELIERGYEDTIFWKVEDSENFLLAHNQTSIGLGQREYKWWESCKYKGNRWRWFQQLTCQINIRLGDSRYFKSWFCLASYYKTLIFPYDQLYSMVVNVGP